MAGRNYPLGRIGRGLLTAPSNAIDWAAERCNDISLYFEGVNDRLSPIYLGMEIIGFESQGSTATGIGEAGFLLAGMGLKALAHPVRAHRTYKELRGEPSR